MQSILQKSDKNMKKIMFYINAIHDGGAGACHGELGKIFF